MRRVVLLVTTWAVGTVLAVTLAWWAVGRVSSEVVDRPSAPLSNQEVAVALGVDPGGAATTTTTTAGSPGATGPAATTPGASTPATPAVGGTVTAPATTAAPRATVPTSAPTATSTSVPPTTPSAAETTATIDSVGGQVAVRYVGGRVELVWARPKAGFEAEVHDAGPEEVEVRFRSDDHESRVRAFYSGGVPDREVREQDDGESGEG